MKVLLLTLCLATALVAEELYEEVGDDFNASEVLENPRLLSSYVKCLLFQGPCTAEVKRIRDALPEVLETHCAKCTKRQKQLGQQLTQGVKKNHPTMWDELVAHYDPNGKYQDAFKDLLEGN
uniref:Chemosensory protein 6 n=1 Tax=Clostera restitura TaxID=2008422 RepID=A0A385XRL1_9NEOP|nr:chemosensory protein 6 [Clostera restitura]